MKFFQESPDSNQYIVCCSCPFQTNFDIPCHQVYKLLCVKKDHIFVLWHTDFASKGDFKQNLMNQELIISKEEFQLMMNSAKKTYNHLLISNT